MIEEHSQMECVAEVSDAKGLKEALALKKADVLVVDHCCDDCFSVEAIEGVKRIYPHLKILVISHEKTVEEIKKILGIGIKNYLLKDCNEQEITDALMACARGERYFCGQIIDVLLEKELSTQDQCLGGSISERELEVIKYLVAGKRPKEIAAEMHLSYHTIVTHKRNIYAKLNISNSIELARYAVRTGLLKQ